MKNGFFVALLALALAACEYPMHGPRLPEIRVGL